MYNSQEMVAERLRIGRETRVLDLGGAAEPFRFGVVTLVDVVEPRDRSAFASVVRLDLCREQLPFRDLEFDVCIASHTLEDLYNPFLCLEHMKRVARRGYIETPHRGREASFTQGTSDAQIPGWGHHRWSFEDVDAGRFRVIAKAWHLLRDDALRIARWHGPDFFGFFWEGTYTYEVLNTLDERGDQWDHLLEDHNAFVRRHARWIELENAAPRKHAW